MVEVETRMEALNKNNDVTRDTQGEPDDTKEISVQFVSESGESPFPPFEIPTDITPAKLLLVLKAFLPEEEEKNRPYLFYVNNQEVSVSLAETLKYQLIDYESTLSVVYQPQAVFRVRGVTRCSSSLSGHGQPVIAALFSPNGKYLASGSGDKTVRFWDINTETPLYTCKGHTNWVLAISWAPDGSLLASGDKQGHVIVWDPVTGKQQGRTMVGHKKWVTSVVWEPLHLAKGGQARKVASASKDGDVRIWDV